MVRNNRHALIRKINTTHDYLVVLGAILVSLIMINMICAPTLNSYKDVFEPIFDVVGPTILALTAPTYIGTIFTRIWADNLLEAEEEEARRQWAASDEGRAFFDNLRRERQAKEQQEQREKARKEQWERTRPRSCERDGHAWVFSHKGVDKKWPRTHYRCSRCGQSRVDEN